MPTPLDRARALLAEMEVLIAEDDLDEVLKHISAPKERLDRYGPIVQRYEVRYGCDAEDLRENEVKGLLEQLLAAAKSDLAHLERSALVSWTGNPHLITLQQGAA